MVKNGKIEIEIPFSGFYNSIHDAVIDNDIESFCDYNKIDHDLIWDCEIDWNAIQKEYANDYANAFAHLVGCEIDFSEMTSPREYNFSNDRIFGIVDRNDIDRIRAQVYSHPDWSEYVKNNYSSYDGFWSNYDSSVNHTDWTNDVLDECQYESILKFYVKKILGVLDFEFYIASEIYVSDFDSMIDACEILKNQVNEVKK